MGSDTPLEPHQRLVLAERTALSDRLTTLRCFISGLEADGYPPQAAVDAAEMGRLVRQDAAMGHYLAVLDERVAAWA